MRLSDCKTLDDLAKFVPANPEGYYFDERAQRIHKNLVDFIVSKDRESFLALERGFLYGYGEPLISDLFNDEEEANAYAKEKNREKNKKRIEVLKQELAMLEKEQ